MGMNTTNHGKDSNGNWVPMGATIDSAGNPAGNVVAEVTSMPAGPYVVEQGHFASKRMVTGQNILGTAGDYLHSIIITGGMAASAAPGATGKMSLREDAIDVWAFDLQQVNVDLPPVITIPINYTCQGTVTDFYLQTSVLGALAGTGAITLIGRFSA